MTRTVAREGGVLFFRYIHDLSQSSNENFRVDEFGVSGFGIAGAVLRRQLCRLKVAYSVIVIRGRWR